MENENNFDYATLKCLPHVCACCGETNQPILYKSLSEDEGAYYAVCQNCGSRTKSIKLNQFIVGGMDAVEAMMQIFSSAPSVYTKDAKNKIASLIKDGALPIHAVEDILVGSPKKFKYVATLPSGKKFCCGSFGTISSLPVGLSLTEASREAMINPTFRNSIASDIVFMMTNHQLDDVVEELNAMCCKGSKLTSEEKNSPEEAPFSTLSLDVDDYGVQIVSANLSNWNKMFRHLMKDQNDFHGFMRAANKFVKIFESKGSPDRVFRMLWKAYDAEREGIKAMLRAFDKSEALYDMQGVRHAAEHAVVTNDFSCKLATVALSLEDSREIPDLHTFLSKTIAKDCKDSYTMIEFTKEQTSVKSSNVYLPIACGIISDCYCSRGIVVSPATVKESLRITDYGYEITIDFCGNKTTWRLFKNAK